MAQTPAAIRLLVESFVNFMSGLDLVTNYGKSYIMACGPDRGRQHSFYQSALLGGHGRSSEERTGVKALVKVRARAPKRKERGSKDLLLVDRGEEIASEAAGGAERRKNRA
ncbi:hypothetical protein NDU88_006105 [Pleurodeles waltl]|uniref:Uncharacterized protein n=1 Tax=Pleurodeles waltl TaxID=8319 RepID=A0AAV7LQZ9_PLEWA|nr:hypothetical protein NDU88_006105 [Pleurodeles waltl]